MSESTKTIVTHTPGPWWIYFGSHRDSRIYGAWLNYESVEVATISASNKNREADARLIAAAPELLAVLRGVLVNAGSYIDTEWLERAMMALAMAEGRAQP